MLGPVLSLDVSPSNIGMAITDPDRRLVLPLSTLKRQSVEKDSTAVAAICHTRKVTQVVVGLPLEVTGEEGRPARLARQVGEALRQKTSLPVDYYDERYSTLEARDRLAHVGSRTRKAVEDQVAAQVILEDWLEHSASPRE